jgi:hypothetical protein
MEVQRLELHLRQLELEAADTRRELAARVGARAADNGVYGRPVVPAPVHLEESGNLSKFFFFERLDDVRALAAMAAGHIVGTLMNRDELALAALRLVRRAEPVDALTASTEVHRTTLMRGIEAGPLHRHFH